MMAYYGESEWKIFIGPALSVTMRMTIFPVQETCGGECITRGTRLQCEVLPGVRGIAERGNVITG